MAAVSGAPRRQSCTKLRFDRRARALARRRGYSGSAMAAADLTRHEVFDVLTHSRARLLRSVSLGDGLAAAVWRNAEDATTYNRPSHHTLSLYLSGGQGTWRHEAPDRRGEPGRLCVMPAGHESRWVVGGEQSFVHLYFDEEQLAPLAVRLLDREPREVQ